MKPRWYIWGIGIALMSIGTYIASPIFCILGAILALSILIFDIVDFRKQTRNKK
jgi:hypothetical protein